LFGPADVGTFGEGNIGGDPPGFLPGGENFLGAYGGVALQRNTPLRDKKPPLRGG